MKFAHSFSQMLEAEGFPAEWQAAAIRYRQLKKCIKKVQLELAALGLTTEILTSLVEQCGLNDNSNGGKHGPTFQYMFDGTLQSFQPKLVLTVDAKEGIPLALNFSDETRRSLEKLVRQRDGCVPGVDCDLQSLSSASTDSSSSSSSPGDIHCPASCLATIEIPLTSDSEFFHILTSELASLDALQSRTESEIKSEVVCLGDAVTSVAQPKSWNPRSDLYPWREIFRIYVDSGIFFSNLERERHGERPVEKAQERLQWFIQEIERLGLKGQFKSRNSALLLARFLEVNLSIMRVLRFQAINKTAMTKILKKFDKRTALGARQTFPIFIASDPLLATHLAKAICYTMSTHLLNIIPQLDDYLCPICSSISVKPVRLNCTHVFCVRCLVKLQRERKRFCPLCRSDVVLSADSANLDIGLWNFLKVYFPKEAGLKQAENEREVAVEQWRSIHVDNGGCVVM